jgi:hypothetical protein
VHREQYWHGPANSTSAMPDLTMVTMMMACNTATMHTVSATAVPTNPHATAVHAVVPPAVPTAHPADPGMAGAMPHYVPTPPSSSAHGGLDAAQVLLLMRQQPAAPRSASPPPSQQDGPPSRVQMQPAHTPPPLMHQPQPPQPQLWAVP